MEKWATVILGAGRSTRFRSSLPKVLHPIAGKPMVTYLLESLRACGSLPLWMVVGHQAEKIKAALSDQIKYIPQAQQKGTGHALLQAREALEGKAENLLVANADVPFVKAQTLERLMEHHRSRSAALTVLTAKGVPSSGLGRVLRDASGRVKGIVEAEEATEEESHIQEVNSGIFCFAAPWCWKALESLKPGKKGEVYLTDLVANAYADHQRVEALSVDASEEVMGINTRIDLANAEAMIRQQIRERWMLEGVTIVDPASTFIDITVEIGQDTVLEPNTYLQGSSRIGQGCRIGPNSILRDAIIGNDCRVIASVIEESTLEEKVDVGPFSHIRPDSYIETEVHIGNYGEVKKSRLGRGTQMGHFSYVGDAIVGKGVNIGAGTITCNFDGVRKNETIIEDGAFIGSDSMLVAPVRIGARSITAAGAVVTRDVPPDTLVMGVPAKPRPRTKKD